MVFVQTVESMGTVHYKRTYASVNVRSNFLHRYNTRSQEKICNKLFFPVRWLTVKCQPYANCYTFALYSRVSSLSSYCARLYVRWRAATCTCVGSRNRDPSWRVPWRWTCGAICGARGVSAAAADPRTGCWCRPCSVTPGEHYKVDATIQHTVRIDRVING